MDSQYCEHCGKTTTNHYNDFFAAFCSECHRLRPRHVGYATRAFECIHCNRLMDEDYPGQSVCSECEKFIPS